MNFRQIRFQILLKFALFSVANIAVSYLNQGEHSFMWGTLSGVFFATVCVVYHVTPKV